MVTGDDFREAGTAVSRAVTSDGGFPVVVVDGVADSMVVGAWARVVESKGATLVVLGTSAAAPLFTEDGGTRRLELPATFNDVLGRIGYESTTMPVGAKIIHADGTLRDAVATPAPLPAPLPVVEVSEPETLEAPVAPVPAGPVIADAAPATPVFAPAAAPAETTTWSEPAPPVLTPTIVPAVVASPVFAPVADQPAPVVAEPETPTHEPAHEAAPIAIPEPITSLPVPAADQPAAAPIPSPVLTAAGAPETAEAAPAVPPAAAAELPEPLATAEAPAYAPVEWSPPEPVVTPAPVPPPARDPEQEIVHAAAAPAPVAQRPDIFAQMAADAGPVQRTRPRPGQKRGEIIVAAAGKGGVGKSSTALCLASAAADAGLQAIVIDANRGQADLRKYLRLGNANLANAYDAYASGDPSAAILMPKDYAHLRQAAKLDVPDYGIVLGPPSDLADPRWVTANVYGEIIDYARSIADIVVIDTQIIEAPPRTDLWNQAIIPLLSGDAWLLAITDESGPGIENLQERLSELVTSGVNPARTMILAAQFFTFNSDWQAYFQEKYRSLGTVVGNTGIDDDFHLQLNSGRVLYDSPSIRPAIVNILLRATARQDLFAPRDPEPERRASRGGWFGKKKSR